MLRRVREGAHVRRVRRAAAGAALGSLLLAGFAGSAVLPDSGTLDLATDADVAISGSRDLGEAGWTVAPAGDVNGDGIDDMLIGARLADPSDRKNAGAAYVVFGGKQLGKTIDLGNLGSGGFRIDGAAAGDQAGVALAAAGDVNADGLGDVLVGAPGFDRPDNPGQPPDDRTEAPFGHSRGAGAVYLVYGRRGGDVDLASPAPELSFRVTGATPGDELGSAVASLPDVNGDGLREIVIGAPRHAAAGRSESGAAYVIFGRASGDVDLASPGSLDYQLFDGPDASMAGLAVAALGDMNGDGLPEFAVGAPRTSPGGAGFVVFGKPGAARGDLGSADVPGFTVTGAAGESLGVSAGAAGDLNGDGTGDVAFGAPLADNNKRPDSGSVYVVFGKPDVGAIDTAALGPWGYRIDGVSDGDGTGSAEGSAGDFNADGKPDLVIGAAFAGALSRDQAGAAYVVYPQPPGSTLDLGSLRDQGIRLAGAHAGDHTRSVALAGDVDGDGAAADLLIGANRLATGEKDTAKRPGGAYLVLAPHPKPPPPPDPGAIEEVQLDKCVASKNIEAVIDDSGSMSGTDPGRLRERALEMILAKPRNEGKVLGAEEFGDPDADVLIPPRPILPAGDKQNAKLLADLDRLIQADNGGTDYNLAFGSLADANPGASARIFLTDGAHNAGEYRDLHRGGPPTFVIGLSIGRKGPDAERLQRIADETKGRYFPAATGATLPPILDAIDSRLNCDLSLDHYVEPAITDDEQQTEETDLDEDAYSADLSVSWDDPNDGFEIDEIDLLDDSGSSGEAAGAQSAATRVVARVSGRRIKQAFVTQGKGVNRHVIHAGKLTLTGVRGRSYLALRVRGVHGAQKLRVKVRARKVRGTARLSTHVTQSRRRK
jgi:hypothetical protein